MARKTIAAWDMDILNQGLAGFYGMKGGENSSTMGVEVKDMRSRKAHSVFLDDLEGEKFDAVLYDLPGGTMEDLDKVVGGVAPLFKEMREIGYEPVVCTVITPYEDSTKAAAAAFDFIGEAASHVVVKNLMFSSRDLDESGVSAFIFFDGEDKDSLGNLDDRLKKMGGHVFDLPRIDEIAAPKVAKLKLPFREAAGEKGKEMGLPRSTRKHVEVFLEKVDGQCEKMLAKISKKADGRAPAFFVLSNKGGVGKSVFARALFDHLVYVWADKE